MFGILVDVTRCVGCHACVDACIGANGLRGSVPPDQRTSDGLSARRWVNVLRRYGGQYVRRSCLHCLQPGCVAACPSGALYKTVEGPVIYDTSKCTGCRCCESACPNGIPRFEWATPVPVIAKCDMCFERLQAGRTPACVEACPQGALSFGQRQGLLAAAKGAFFNDPTRYMPRVYGDGAVGGTSVLYVAGAELDLMGFGLPLGTSPLIRVAGVSIAPSSPLALGTAALVAGTAWIIRRRMELMHTGRKEASSADTVPGRYGA